MADSVTDDLENNCFICGIGKDYLDAIPHGFDIHVQKEHNLANYLYVFLRKIKIHYINSRLLELDIINYDSRQR